MNFRVQIMEIFSILKHESFFAFFISTTRKFSQVVECLSRPIWHPSHPSRDFSMSSRAVFCKPNVSEVGPKSSDSEGEEDLSRNTRRMIH